MLNADTFELDRYLAQYDERLLGTRAGRQILTRLDPLLFGIVYLRKHLTSTDGSVTFADFHLELVEMAKLWVRPVTGPIGPRDAYIAPRDVGKTTWLYLILPMWAAAHGHVKFAAAFADSGDQAEIHLSTFKNELDGNVLLRQDYPTLCKPHRRPAGTTIADRQNMLYAKSGFIFAARGIDSGTLGMKVNERRPDLLILDDIEPGEAKYSEYLAVKRLSTVQDVILPLNAKARVVIVGTVTMPNSIVHQLVKSARGEESQDWIKNEEITAHYYPPIVVRKDGTERSCWPAKWPIDWLQTLRHTRAYAKNFANDPMGNDGGYWSIDDFNYDKLETCTRWVLSIDPAVTTSASSDYTGMAVVGWSPSANRCLVTDAIQVKLDGPSLRTRALAIIEHNPNIKVILVEDNQGGDLWRDVFHHMGVKVVLVPQSVKKEVRAAQVLGFYQKGQVCHQGGLIALEEQMVAFGAKGVHDDMVDAVGTAVLAFMKPKPKKHSSGQQVAYV